MKMVLGSLNCLFLLLKVNERLPHLDRKVYLIAQTVWHAATGMTEEAIKAITALFFLRRDIPSTVI